MRAILCFAALAIASVPDRFASRGPGGGGALFSPSFSPDGSRLWVGCDMSGLYASPDAGRSWSLLPHGQVQGGRSSSVSSSGSALFTINSEGEAPRVARSLDGGSTWSDVPNDPTEGGAYGFSVHPSDPRRILVTGWSSLHATRDGGATWKTLQGEPDADAGVLLGGVFWDGADVYLATNGGLFVSHDSGWTFAKNTASGIPAGDRIVALSGGRKGSTVRLLAVSVPVGDVYNGIPVEDFHKTTTSLWTWSPGASSWTASTGGIGANHTLYLLGQAATSIDTLYAAGGVLNQDQPVVYRSVDGGESWSQILSIAGNANVATGWAGAGGVRDWSYGGMACGFSVAAGNGLSLAYTDYGFIHVSDDGGATWRQGYLDPRDQNAVGASIPTGRTYHSSGLENTSVWDVSWSDSLHLFAGYTDIRATRSIDGGVTWGFGYSGLSENTAYRVVKAPDGTLYAATSSVHDLYQSTYLSNDRIKGGTGNILVSKDKGATWSVFHAFGHPVVWIALDPNDPNKAYASVVDSAAGGVYSNTDLASGASGAWVRLAAPPRTQGHPFNLVVLSDGSVLSTWSGLRTKAGAFTATSGVFRFAGGAWQDLSDAGMRFWTKDVVADPADATGRTWWVGVFSGWGGNGNDLGGLYRTTDAGASWTRLWSGHNVESVGIPPSGTEIYVSTESDGLWASVDRTAAPPALARVDSYPFRHPVRILFNPYDPAETWVTSFGNGLRVGRRDGKAVDGIRRNATARGGISLRVRGSELLVEGLRSGPTTIRTLRPDGRQVQRRDFTVDPTGIGSMPLPGSGLWILDVAGQGRARILVP